MRRTKALRLALFSLAALGLAGSCTSSDKGGRPLDAGGDGRPGSVSGAGPGAAGSSAAGGSGTTGGRNSGGGSSPAGGASAGGGAAATGGAGAAGAPSTDIVAAGVRWVGRADTTDASAPRFSWSGSGFVAEFSGTSLDVELESGDGFVYRPVVDGSPAATFAARGGRGMYTVASGLAPGVHTVALYRQTEGQQGNSGLIGLSVAGGSLRSPPRGPGRLIEVIGDSISCGYGNLGADETCGFSYDTESHWETYGAFAARRLGADLSTVAISGRGVFRNIDGGTDDTIPKVYSRILTNDATPTWGFGPKADVVVINLGTNDFQTGDPGSAFREAYSDFVTVLRREYPGALLLCAVGPMVSDSYPAGAMHLTRLRGYIDSVVADKAAAGDGKIRLLEFPTQTPDEYGCDYHPNVSKHQSMGNVLVDAIRAELPW